MWQMRYIVPLLFRRVSRPRHTDFAYMNYSRNAEDGIPYDLSRSQIFVGCVVPDAPLLHLIWITKNNSRRILPAVLLILLNFLFCCSKLCRLFFSLALCSLLLRLVAFKLVKMSVRSRAGTESYCFTAVNSVKI